MSAADNLNPTQFSFAYDNNRVSARLGDTEVGHLGMQPSGSIRSLVVSPDYQRQGVATGMWNAAHQAAAEGRGPVPQHSEWRTDAGDAWARKVGGELPERAPNIWG